MAVNRLTGYKNSNKDILNLKRLNSITYKGVINTFVFKFNELEVIEKNGGPVYLYSSRYLCVN